MPSAFKPSNPRERVRTRKVCASMTRPVLDLRLRALLTCKSSRVPSVRRALSFSTILRAGEGEPSLGETSLPTQPLRPVSCHCRFSGAHSTLTRAVDSPSF